MEAVIRIHLHCPVKTDKKKAGPDKKVKGEELEKLGNAIRKKFEKKYGDLTAFAIAAECSPEYARRVMQGKQNPGYTYLINMADALDTTLDELRNDSVSGKP
ncbi:MAG: helix-turn-helix transcriptional regulator [Bacteroidia bacterium]